jgi:hypothetical protein
MAENEKYLVFSREKSGEEAEKIAGTYCVAIDKIVDRSVSLLIDIRDTDSTLVNTTILGRFLHVIDMADAISILARSGSGFSCSMLYRSCLETTITVRYLTMSKKNRDKRTLALAYSDILAYEKGLHAASPDYESGKRNKKRKNDSVYASAQDIDPAEIKATIEGLQQRKNDPLFRETQREYDRTATKNKGKKRNIYSINWFNLYDGPSGLKELADKCGMAVEYDQLYSMTSNTIHGRVLSYSPVLQDEDFGQGRVRDPESVEQWISLTESLLYHCLCIMIMHYTPDEKLDMQGWYVDEVRPHLPGEMPPLDGSTLNEADIELAKLEKKRIETTEDDDPERNEA